MYTVHVHVHMYMYTVDHKSPYLQYMYNVWAYMYVQSRDSKLKSFWVSVLRVWNKHLLYKMYVLYMYMYNVDVLVQYTLA